MSNHLLQLPTMVVSFAIFTVALAAGAADSVSPAKSNSELPAAELRPTRKEPVTKIGKTGAVVKTLGLTLTDPTKELKSRYGLSPAFGGPIITQVQDTSFFPKGMAPSTGCSIWIVEHPAKGFGLKLDDLPSFRPQTTQEFADAIIVCVIPPAEYVTLFELKKKTAREQAAKQKDDPALQSRLHEIADIRLTAEQIGKYTCRLIYNYPDQKGTMTTEVYLTTAELDEIRQLSRK